MLVFVETVSEMFILLWGNSILFYLVLKNVVFVSGLLFLTELYCAGLYFYNVPFPCTAKYQNIIWYYTTSEVDKYLFKWKYLSSLERKSLFGGAANNIWNMSRSLNYTSFYKRSQTEKVETHWFNL